MVASLGARVTQADAEREGMEHGRACSEEARELNRNGSRPVARSCVLAEALRKEAALRTPGVASHRKHMG